MAEELEQDAKLITKRIAELKKIRKIIRRHNKDPVKRRKLNVERITSYIESLRTCTSILTRLLE
jgi:hypothetical protein